MLFDQIEITRQEHGFKRATPVAEPPGGALILSGQGRYIDAETGEFVLGIAHLPGTSDVEAARTAVRNLAPYGATGGRLSGISYPSVAFGYVPPVPLRRRYAASRSIMDMRYPTEAAHMEALVARLANVFSELDSDLYAEMLEASRQILPEWRIGDTPWSSGIINTTRALPYHRDSDNLKGVASSMIVFRDGVSGGYLHLPDYGVYVDCDDRTVVMFEGSHALHGVTRIKLHRPGAYRHSVVCYSRQRLRTALPYAEEVRRAQILRTESEESAAAVFRARSQETIDG